MKKTLILLFFSPIIGLSQVDLAIAEDYIFGRSNIIFTELEIETNDGIINKKLILQ